MTRDELIHALQRTGKGGDTVVTEGCCGGCYVSVGVVVTEGTPDASLIVIQERP